MTGSQYVEILANAGIEKRAQGQLSGKVKFVAVSGRLAKARAHFLLYGQSVP